MQIGNFRTYGCEWIGGYLYTPGFCVYGDGGPERETVGWILLSRGQRPALSLPCFFVDNLAGGRGARVSLNCFTEV